MDATDAHRAPINVFTCKAPANLSSVNLIKGPGVGKTAVPNLVDCFDCFDIVFAVRPSDQGLDSSPPHTVLVMIRKLEEFVAKEFIGPATFSAQVAGSDL